MPTHKENDIKNKTGLSDNAIDKLLNVYNATIGDNAFDSENALNYLDIVSNLLTSEDFSDMLKYIILADEYETTTREMNNSSLEQISKNIDTINYCVGMLAMCKYNALIKFNKMIDNRYKADKMYMKFENDFKITKE